MNAGARAARGDILLFLHADTLLPEGAVALLNSLETHRLGYKCNQSCVHCHVNARPSRTEMMPRQIINDMLAFMQASHIGKLDITGGAPELNPHFRDLISAARSLDVHALCFWK